MKTLSRLILLLLVSALAACANFQTIETFAKVGNTVSDKVNSDINALNTGCTDLIKHHKILSAAENRNQPATGTHEKSCQALDGALTKLANTSVLVLDNYHGALGSLAKGDNWTVTKELKASITAIGKIPVGSGTVGSNVNIPLFSAAATALADLITSAVREKQVRSLLGTPVDWKTLLDPLREWYVGTEANNRLGIYGPMCENLRSQWDGTATRYASFAQCDTAKHCEPLLAAASIVAAQDRSAKFAHCAAMAGAPPPAHAVSMAGVLDQWIKANEALKKDAFKPDFEQFAASLSKLIEQRDAIVEAGQ